MADPTSPRSPIPRWFWHLRATDPGARLADLTDASGATGCASTDADSPGEAWLESVTRASGMAALCEQLGWLVLDDLVATPLVTLENPAATGDPTHRLHLHYVADAEELTRLDAWYAEEHEEMLLRSSAWCRIRRFRTGSADAPGRLVVHDVADPAVLASAELREAMDTPWRRELAATDWFGRSSRQTWEISARPEGAGTS